MYENPPIVSKLTPQIDSPIWWPITLNQMRPGLDQKQEGYDQDQPTQEREGHRYEYDSLRESSATTTGFVAGGLEHAQQPRAGH